MTIKKFFMLLMCVPSTYAQVRVPKIILHVDVNKTIMAEDPAGGKSLSDVLIGALAESYEDRWDNSLENSITYKEYVDTHLLPGAKDDRELKKLRNAKVSNFLHFLAETNHSLHNEIQERYASLIAKLNAHTSIIFRSFFDAVRYLDSHKIPYSIVLRTFGKDLDRVIEEFDRCVAPGFFSWKGEFSEGILTMTCFKSGEIMVLKTSAEIYAFLQANGHVAIQDDWIHWNKNGESKEHGKLFPVDIWDPCFISLFADDNAHPKDGILNPRDPVKNEALDLESLIENDYIRVVDTLEAIENDNYFIHYILGMIWWHTQNQKQDRSFKRDANYQGFPLEHVDWPLLIHPKYLDWRYITVSFD